MRKQFSGNATLATLTGALAANGTTFTTNTSIGYPATGPFVVLLTRLSDGAQEKVLVSARSDVTFTVQTRGYDGTVAAAFVAGDQVRHVVDAATIDEANEHVNNLDGHVPPGGSDGMSLVKQSGADYDAAWELIAGGGGEGQLISGGTAFKGARAFADGSPTIANATVTPMVLNGETFDSDGFHDNVTNNTRFTVPVGMGGKYLIVGAIGYGAQSVTGRRNANIRKNGSVDLHYSHIAPIATANSTIVPTSTIAELVPGDYIELVGYQDSGATLSIVASLTYLSMVYLDKSIGSGGTVGARAYSTVAQTAANASATAMALAAESWDSDNFHDNTTNNSRLTVPSGKSGKYLVNANLVYAVNATGSRWIGIRKNGAEILNWNSSSAASSAVGTYIGNTCIADLNAGDYVEVVSWQDSGAGLNVVETGTFLELVWLEGLYTPARPAGASYKGASAWRSGTQSLASAGWDSVNFNTEMFDTDGLFSASPGTIMTVPQGMGGKWLVEGQIYFGGSATGTRHVRIMKNGTVALSYHNTPAVGTFGVGLPFSAVVDLLAGDNIRISAYQDSGSALNIESGSDSTRLTMTYLDKSVGTGGSVGVSTHRSTTQSIGASSTTPIEFNAESFDSDGFHDNAVAPNRLTVPAGKSGKYIINAVISFAGNATGLRQARIHKNGSLVDYNQVANQGAGETVPVRVSSILNLNAGDYIEIAGWQNSGSALDVVAGTYYTNVSMFWLEGLTTDHGALAGLADDDHPQYALRSVGSFIDGTAAAPAVSFASDLDTGMYLSSANVLGLSTGGTLQWFIQTDRIQHQMKTWFPGGTAAAPAISFASDNDTGIYSATANQLEVTTGGTRRWLVNDTGMSLFVPSYFTDGTSAAPGIAFFNDGDTGFYRQTGNVLHFTAGGTVGWYTGSGGFYPAFDNAFTMGASGARLSQVWAANGTIQTSDQLTKSSIKPTELGLDFINGLDPVTYRFKDGKRPHEGLVAQQVKQTMDALGVADFAGYIDPAIGALKPQKPRKRKGESAESFKERMDSYEWELEQYERDFNAPKGLRYTEFIGPLVKSIQELSAELKQVRAELEALKNA